MTPTVRDAAASPLPQHKGPWPPAPLTRNAAANWTLMASSVLYSLAITPFVVRALGSEGYGIWSFLNGLTTYADLFYLGLGGALIRYVADFRARGDVRSMQRLSSFVFTVYLAIGALMVLIAVAASPFAARAVNVRLQAIAPNEIALSCILIGIRMASLFAGSVFSGMLFAYERNDVLKGVMIASTWARFALIPLFVGGNHPLLVLALVSAVTGWLETFVLALLARAVTGGIRIRLVVPRLADLRPIYAFGILSFLLQVTAKLISYTDTTVIGVMLGAASVAMYSLPLQLAENGRYAVSALVAVMLPRLVALRSDNQPKQMGAMFVRVARLSCFLGVFLSLTLVFVGPAFLARWVGPEFGTSEARWILVWLAAASVCQVLGAQVPLPFYQSLHLLHLPVAVLTAEAVANLAGSIWLARPYGPAGVAFATFVPSLCISLVIIPAHLCRVLQLSLRQVLIEVGKPSLVCGVVIGAVLFALNVGLPDAAYGVIFMKIAIAGAAAAAIFAAIFPSEDRDLLTGLLRPLARPFRRNAAAQDVADPELVRLFLGSDPRLSPAGVARWTHLFTRDAAAMSDVPSGGWFMVALKMDEGSAIARLAAWAWTLVRMRLVEVRLRQLSFAPAACFGVYPSLGDPGLVFEMNTSAAGYASAFLLPQDAGTRGRIRRWLAAWSGCDPSLGAVVVVARRR